MQPSGTAGREQRGLCAAAAGAIFGAHAARPEAPVRTPHSPFKMALIRTWLSSARRAYRRVVAPAGKARLRRSIREGMPESLHRPLEFLFDGRLSPVEAEVVGRVEGIREAFVRKNGTYEVVNREAKILRVSAAQLASKSSIDREGGTFLYLCSQASGARTILELGSCVGISGGYLASPPSCERFLTLEGSPALARVAAEHVGHLSERAQVVNAMFDDALDRVLPALTDGIDLAYIDGHHKHEPTLHYFGRIEPYLNPGALVVFDDIHLSEGMWRAWKLLRTRRGFAATVGAGRFGVCVWDGRTAVPVHHDLCPYLGCTRRA